MAFAGCAGEATSHLGDTTRALVAAAGVRPILDECGNRIGTLVPRSVQFCVDLENDGLRSHRRRAWFVFACTRKPAQMAWTAWRDDAFLVLDRNGDGVINDGQRAIRRRYRTAAGINRRTERTLPVDIDDDNNGRIDTDDAVWTRLMLWTDTARRPLAAGELRPC